jgi:hypothetical protein
VLRPSWFLGVLGRPTWRKKTARFVGLAVWVDSVCSLRAPFDSLRRGPEKAIKVEKVEARDQVHFQPAP